MPWANNSPVAPDSLQFGCERSGSEENGMKATSYSDAVRVVLSISLLLSDIIIRFFIM